MISQRKWIEKSYSRTVSQLGKNLGPVWKNTDRGFGTPIKSSSTDVLTSGANERLRKEIYSLIENAQNMVVICSFLISDDDLCRVIEQVARRGVRVYILVASETRLKQVENEGEFEAELRDYHEKMLVRLSEFVLFRSSETFHAKIVLVDPADSTTATGILLTGNLTVEAFQRNEELGVHLNPTEIDEAFAYLRYAMWELAEHETVGGRFSAIKPMNELPKPKRMTSVVATLPEAAEIRDAALKLVQDAKLEIVVSSFGWKLDDAIVIALCAQARGGVKVKILCRIREKSMPALLKLAEAGAEVYGYKWLHAKSIWTDAGRGMIMSANFEPRGMTQGFELGVKLDGSRAAALESELRNWIHGARWRLFNKGTLEESDRAIIAWKNGHLEPPVDIPNSKKIKLADVTVGSVDEVGIEPELRNTDRALAQELCFLWAIRAPIESGNQ